MVIGTAGFTAALALLRMTDNRQIALARSDRHHGRHRRRGHARHRHLQPRRLRSACHQRQGRPLRLPARASVPAECVDRHQLVFSGKPMDSAKYGGMLDNVGGKTLAGFLPLIAPYGNAAICGLAGSPELSTTVMPFIIRGVSVLGIASAGHRTRCARRGLAAPLRRMETAPSRRHLHEGSGTGRRGQRLRHHARGRILWPYGGPDHACKCLPGQVSVRSHH